MEPNRAGKVTGMLLELDDAELFELLLPADVAAGVSALVDVVAEARQVLVDFEEEQAATAESQAATVIQAHWRGATDRLHVSTHCKRIARTHTCCAHTCMHTNCM